MPYEILRDPFHTYPFGPVAVTVVTLQRKIALQTSCEILEWMCLNMVIPLAYLFVLLVGSPPPADCREEESPSLPEHSRMVANTSAVGFGP